MVGAAYQCILGHTNQEPPNVTYWDLVSSDTDTHGSVSTDTGAYSPGTMADDNAVGTITWNNPNNAKVSDNSDATASMTSEATSHYLKATNFGFTIPVGATIDGIIVEIERAYGTTTTGKIRDSEIKIVKADGSISTTNLSTATELPSSDTYKDYGGPTNLWGETWSAENINHANFGVAIAVEEYNADSRQANVDHIRITIYYTT